MNTNSCYSIVANLDGIDMNDQDAKWSYAKRGCSSAFEQETETIFSKRKFNKRVLILIIVDLETYDNL